MLTMQIDFYQNRTVGGIVEYNAQSNEWKVPGFGVYGEVQVIFVPSSGHSSFYIAGHFTSSIQNNFILNNVASCTANSINDCFDSHLGCTNMGSGLPFITVALGMAKRDSDVLVSYQAGTYSGLSLWNGYEWSTLIAGIAQVVFPHKQRQWKS